MKKKFNLKVLIICLLIAFAPGFFGSLFTLENVNSQWYFDNKPTFTPPNWLFGPVWTILYLLIGLSMFLVWTKSKDIHNKKKIALAFGLNLFLNGLWSFVFFGRQMAFPAFIVIVGIWLTIIWMIFISWDINRKASWILVPYLLWVTFAGILNAGFL